MLALGAVALACACTGAIVEEPLAPRSGPTSGTMFKELDPAEVGIVAENAFADPNMWGEHYEEFTLGAVGTGVAIGDYDGDGRPDVFVVSKTEQSRLFRNLGNWKFEDVTKRAGLSPGPDGWLEAAKAAVGLGKVVFVDEPRWWKQGATFADVDNDGWLDLYLCRFGAPNLLFMNRGDGTFSEEAGARGLAINDACGVGAFCDFDRDGWLDVYVTTNILDAAANPGGQRGYLLRNNRDGTFKDITDSAGIRGGSQSHAATWWDFDSDGWPDLHVANDFESPDRLYRNNRDGTFSDVIDAVVPNTPYSSMGADLGDIDNDSFVDLFVADMAATTNEKDQRGMAYSRSAGNAAVGAPGMAPQTSRNMLYLGTGTGHVREAAFLAGLEATDWTWSVRMEDLDNDGLLDLFVTNGMIREFQNADLIEQLMRASNIAERIEIMRSSPKLAEENLAYRNLGELRFEESGEQWGLRRRGVSFGSAFGDLDGDGDLDLIYSNYEGGVTIFRNDSAAGHRAIFQLHGKRSNRWGVGATVRIGTASGMQTRTLVVARGYLSSSEPVLHFGLGGNERIDWAEVVWPGGTVQRFAGLPVDRKFTISEDEGNPDVAEANHVRAHGRTLFSSVKAPQRVEAPRRNLCEADFNRDGQIDRFVAGAVVLGELPIAGPGSLLAAKDGSLVDVTDVVAPALRDIGPVGAAIWCDVDVDGWPDLVVACDWGGVRFFRNDRGGRLEDRSAETGFTTAGPGRWSALAAGDFSGDGRPDIVAGNLGLNTQYAASAERPALLFVGDFAGRGSPQGIEARFEGDALFSWCTRKEMGRMIPDVLRRFPRNNTYARATLPAIVGEERLAAARRFAATELRSGVFLSQEDGTHRFQPLPRIAQIAPVRGAAVGDVDHDGFADIYAVQNARVSQASFGDFTGGLSQLMLGDGRGNFTAVPPAESGLVVPGETLAVEARDFDGDGWLDLIVTRGDGTAVAFRNNGVVDREPPGAAEVRQ